MMRRGGIFALCLAAFAATACATRPEPAPRVENRPDPIDMPATSSQRPPPTRQPQRPTETPSGDALDALLAVMGPAALPGWADEDHRAAFSAYLAGCGAAKSVAAQETCNRARLMRRPSDAEARGFFEQNFAVEAIPGKGVLTAYFAPEYEARERPGGEFNMPVRPPPSDLRPGQPYATREEIDKRPAGDALAWMRAEDLFFLQIQGSGTLLFPGGQRKKAVFAAHNSRPFTGIANPMRDRGLLPGDNTSGESIRSWLAENRGERANEIMRINPRYVFLRLERDDGRDPAGAAGIPLPAGHAIAVDPSHHDYGDVYWIEGTAPILAGAFASYRRLVMALDTGGAIRGRVRADLYLGKGDAAGVEAGRVRHDLRMYRLVPRGG